MLINETVVLIDSIDLFRYYVVVKNLFTSEPMSAALLCNKKLQAPMLSHKQRQRFQIKYADVFCFLFFSRRLKEIVVSV